MGMRNDVRALRLPTFRKFWTGHAVSCFGDGMVPLVTAFAVIGQGHGAADLGAVLAVGVACRIAATLVGGVLADRFSRLRLMAGADAVRFLVQASLALLLMTGHGSVLVFAVCNAVYGIAGGFYGPASKGLMPTLVGKDLLQQASALQSLTRSMSMIAGPIVAGLLMPVAGAQGVYLIDAATFAVNVVVLLRLPGATTRGIRGQSFLADLRQGWSEVTRRRWLVANLAVHAVWNFGMAAFFVLGPVLAAERFGGVAAWGMVSSAMAAGALLGGVLALRWQPRRPLVAGNLILAASACPLLALWQGYPVFAVAVAAAVCNCCIVVLNTLWESTLQRVMPDQVLSRVSSYDYLLTMISMPIAYALIGPVTKLVGTNGVLLGGAALLAIPGLLVCAMPAVRRITRHDRSDEFVLTTTQAAA